MKSTTENTVNNIVATYGGCTHCGEHNVENCRYHGETNITSYVNTLFKEKQENVKC